ncbi:hypothetical protein LIER_16091 [Lithospermum erythrorhizon]|uniref:Uncharacterized protein n=1 Tax=Lithospermum erythrorhizon TaxID=34254 RepID=A0AAV3Q9Y7_LITER
MTIHGILVVKGVNYMAANGRNGSGSPPPLGPSPCWFKQDICKAMPIYFTITEPTLPAPFAGFAAIWSSDFMVPMQAMNTATCHCQCNAIIQSSSKSETKLVLYFS